MAPRLPDQERPGPDSRPKAHWNECTAKVATVPSVRNIYRVLSPTQAHKMGYLLSTGGCLGVNVWQTNTAPIECTCNDTISMPWPPGKTPGFHPRTESAEYRFHVLFSLAKLRENPKIGPRLSKTLRQSLRNGQRAQQVSNALSRRPRAPRVAMRALLAPPTAPSEQHRTL